MLPVRCIVIHGGLFDVSCCLDTESLVNSDHTTLALASALSIFLMLFAVVICILVLREFNFQARVTHIYCVYRQPSFILILTVGFCRRIQRVSQTDYIHYICKVRLSVCP